MVYFHPTIDKTDNLKYNSIKSMEVIVDVQLWAEKLSELLGRKIALTQWVYDQYVRGLTPQEVAESVVLVRVA